jgi:hypothetical protein
MMENEEATLQVQILGTEKIYGKLFLAQAALCMGNKFQAPKILGC